MNIFQAIILGVIQGVTEFLPVSSSGHLVLFQKIFNIQEPTMMFDVVLHIGTLIAVFIIFWKKISELIKNPFQKYFYNIIIATIPAVIVALFFGDKIDFLFESGKFLWLAFFITGTFLLIADKSFDMKNKNNKHDDNILYEDAFEIGIAQAIAIVPGISRSGSSISASLLCGLEKNTAAKFSFLMSIPAILGAVVLQIKNIFENKILISQINYLPFFFGFVFAFLSGYCSIKFMLKLISENKLKFFAYYVFIIGILIFIDQYFLKIYF